jgi:hypothetical protein
MVDEIHGIGAAAEQPLLKKPKVVAGENRNLLNHNVLNNIVLNHNVRNHNNVEILSSSENQNCTNGALPSPSPYCNVNVPGGYLMGLVPGLPPAPTAANPYEWAKANNAMCTSDHFGGPATPAINANGGIATTTTGGDGTNRSTQAPLAEKAVHCAPTAGSIATATANSNSLKAILW